MSTGVIALHKLANEVGSSLLDWSSDPLIVFLCITVIAAVLGILSSIIRKRLPSLAETANGILALLSLVSVIQIVSVMVLTQPPAIDKLGSADRAFVSIFSLIVLSTVAVYGLYLVFFKRP